MRLKEKRKNRGMSQAKLAEKLSVSQQIVSKWENGEAMPSAAKLPEIARVLGCSIDELLKAK